MSEALGTVHACGRGLLRGPKLVFDQMAAPVLEVMDTTSYNLVQVQQCYMGMYCFHLVSSMDCLHGLFYNSEDGGSTFLQNVCKLLLDYTLSHPRKLFSSLSLPWEPQIWVGNWVGKDLKRYEYNRGLFLLHFQYSSIGLEKRQILPWLLVGHARIIPEHNYVECCCYANLFSFFKSQTLPVFTDILNV
jgi:hypothetical protein